MSTAKPRIVIQRVYERFGGFIEVADFTDGNRPAFRVKCHCRNCGWESQARFKVGTLIELWSYCPKCERRELSCHGGFVMRDERTEEQEAEHYKLWAERVAESYRRHQL